MRSLFFRIFVSFLGATVLIGVLLLALALTTDPHRIIFAPTRSAWPGSERSWWMPTGPGGAPP